MLQKCVMKCVLKGGYVLRLISLLLFWSIVNRKWRIILMENTQQQHNNVGGNVLKAIFMTMSVDTQAGSSRRIVYFDAFNTFHIPQTLNFPFRKTDFTFDCCLPFSILIHQKQKKTIPAKQLSLI